MQRMKFLKQFKFFEHWQNNILDKILEDQLEQVTFNRMQIIYSEGDPSKYIYFVKKGQIEVSLKLDLQTIIKEKYTDKKLKVSAKKENLPSVLDHMKKKPPKMSQIVISLYTANKYFGEWELL